MMDVSASTQDREVFDCCRLIVARLMAEAVPDVAVYSAHCAGERLAIACSARLIVEAAQRALLEAQEDAKRKIRMKLKSMAI